MKVQGVTEILKLSETDEINIEKKERIKELEKNFNELFGSDSINNEELKKLPKSPGTYIVINNDEIVYSGSSGSLFRRTSNFRLPNKTSKKNHVLNKKLHNQGIEYLDYYSKCSFKGIETRDIYAAKLLEQLIISMFKPKYNSEK